MLYRWFWMSMICFSTIFTTVFALLTHLYWNQLPLLPMSNMGLLQNLKILKEHFRTEWTEFTKCTEAFLVITGWFLKRGNFKSLQKCLKILAEIWKWSVFGLSSGVLTKEDGKPRSNYHFHFISNLFSAKFCRTFEITSKEIKKSLGRRLFFNTKPLP